MVECDGPVLAQDLVSVLYDAIVVVRDHLVQVVLMEADKAPETLQHNLLMSHMGD